MRGKWHETCLQISDAFAKKEKETLYLFLCSIVFKEYIKLICMLIHIPHWGGKEQPSGRNAWRKPVFPVIQRKSLRSLD